MIKNIVFDFGGVLVKHDFRTFFARQLGSEEQADWFLANILTEANNNLLDKGEKPFDHYIDQWCRTWPDYADTIRAFDRHYTDMFVCEIPGMTQLMADLKAAGYRLLGLSNWSVKVFDVMKKFPEPFKELEGWLISHEVCLMKPDVEIYRAFCQRFGVKADECLFVDDRPANIAGAQHAGMHATMFTSAGALRTWLNDRHLLSDTP